MPRPATPIILDEQQRADLRSLARSRTLPHQLVQRARIRARLRGRGAGHRHRRTVVTLNKNTAMKWRKRYAQYGIEGLHDERHPGRPRTHDDDRVAEVMNTALQSLPAHRAHWSVRTIAAQTGVSKSTVQRWFDLFGVQPHRQRTFQLSNGPCLVEKVRDIVGLYLSPPDKAVVLCVDEKTQIQALDHTRPMLSIGLAVCAVENF